MCAACGALVEHLRTIASAQHLGSGPGGARPRASREPCSAGGQDAGISPETLRKIETGRALTPAFFTVAALARALDLSRDEPVSRCAPAVPPVVPPAEPSVPPPVVPPVAA
ncbi:helix-turn-helix transcriptional regulator [Streptomyces sp. NPDC050388]|uniref:helix-turn-helix domain-containing protein n=1 Tax=Streptomyces sp. NPDC050388 TaxID=3155781 RepID=UPI00343D5CE3